jgi:hypothetical protein
MRFPDLKSYLASNQAPLARGPVALVFVEDPVEVASTLRHHAALGFAKVIGFVPSSIPVDPEVFNVADIIDCDVHTAGAVSKAVNRVIAAAQGTWIYYCYNGEYLFYPFSETRRIGEMLSFHEGERREAMVAFVVDLYAPDRAAFPDGIDRDNAHFDQIGYYALARSGPDGAVLDRQLDFFGGLKWRFEEHVPYDRRRIDRTALFKAKPGLELRDDHTLNDAEMNTYACPWHNNLTAAIVSYRTAKALATNPGSKQAIKGFAWENSAPFNWSSRQLMDHGLMEPGQWF